MDLLYWIAVLFWGWRVILLQKGGGLGVVDEKQHDAFMSSASE